MLTPAQAAFLAALPQRPTAFNPLRNIDRRTDPTTDSAAPHGRGGEPRPGSAARRARRATVDRSRTRAVSCAALRRDGSGGRGNATAAANRDDAGSGAAGGGRGDSRTAAGRRSVSTARATSRSSCSTTRAASGSRGRVPATISTPNFGGAINGPLVPRQPGSALKPFTYALAFEEGRTPATVLADIPSSFPTAEAGVLYSPRNYDGRYRGPLLARRALAGSENVPAVALASEHRRADTGAIPARAPASRPSTAAGPTTAWASRWATPRSGSIELVAAYAMFARGGDLDGAGAAADAPAPQRSGTRRQPADGVLDHQHPERRRRARRSSSVAAAAWSSRSRWR